MDRPSVSQSHCVPLGPIPTGLGTMGLGPPSLCPTVPPSSTRPVPLGPSPMCKPHHDPGTGTQRDWYSEGWDTTELEHKGTGTQGVGTRRDWDAEDILYGPSSYVGQTSVPPSSRYVSATIEGEYRAEGEFIKRYIVERTKKTEVRPEEQSEKWKVVGRIYAMKYS